MYASRSLFYATVLALLAGQAFASSAGASSSSSASSQSSAFAASSGTTGTTAAQGTDTSGGTSGTVVAQSTNSSASGTNSSASSSNASSAAVAELTNGLSQSCQSAAAGLLASSFASCANLIALVDVVTAQGSIVAPLNTWITGVCSTAPCSNATLSQARSSIQSGCATDIQNNVPLALTLNTILMQYPEIRDMLCLQATSNSSFCVTDTLSNVEKANNTLITLNQVEMLLTGGMTALVSSLNDVPSSAYCTDCGEAIFTKAEPITTNTSASAGASAKSALAGKCGSNFVSGEMPSTVAEATVATANSSSSSSSNKSASENHASRVTMKGGLLGAIATAVMLSAVSLLVV